MKLPGILIIIVLSNLYALNLRAQLYEWTDERGVKHYSNVSPTESAEEVKKKQEKKENRSPGTTPRPVENKNTFKRKTFTPKEDEPESKYDSPSDAEQDSEEKFYSNLNLDLEKFPVTQDDLINEENARLQEIKKYSEKNNIKREDIIQKEKNRLIKAIEDLNAAPLSKFGSLKNKRRQLTYYRYRLEALENSPETYFGDLPE
jgi:hypothetical protein